MDPSANFTELNAAGREGVHFAVCAVAWGRESSLGILPKRRKE